MFVLQGGRSKATGAGGLVVVHVEARRGVTALAVEGRSEEHRHIDAPASRRVKPLAEGEKPDHMATREADAEDRQEALLDEAIEETFPGSDPISPKHIT